MIQQLKECNKVELQCVCSVLNEIKNKKNEYVFVKEQH